MKKNYAVYAAFAALAVFGALGLAHAESGSSTVDGATVDSLFESVFHRPADAVGRAFHLRHDLKTILRDFRSSPEQRYYGALFKAVKSYEVAQRAPGELTEAEKQSQLDLIDSALSTLLAWVGTLPDQDPCLGVVGPQEAKDAIEAARATLSSAAQSEADDGELSRRGRIGPPRDIPIFRKCMRPTPGPVVCTADAMVCPDGSSVGRSGPRCEFECAAPTADN